MRPAVSELDRLIAAGIGSRLDQAGIGRVTVHLQDAAEPGEMTRPAISTSVVLKTIGRHRRIGSARGDHREHKL